LKIDLNNTASFKMPKSFKSKNYKNKTYKNDKTVTKKKFRV